MSRTFLRTFMCLLLVSASALAAEPLIELRTPGQAIRGRLAARSDRLAWLMTPEGELSRVELGTVTGFEKVADHFAPSSPQRCAEVLRKELGHEYELTVNSHFVIAAPPGVGRLLTAVLEDVSQTFGHSFSVRGIPLRRAEFPLITVVYGTRDEFVRSLEQAGEMSDPNVRGFYSPLSNRIAVCLEERRSHTRTAASALSATVPRDLIDTVRHEAVHQLAFNAGLHHRLGANPVWIVEGLATVFEPAPDGNHRSDARQRINQSRLRDFRRFVSRRPSESLHGMIAGDELFRTQPLEAYAQAWAFSWFLLETRPADYAAYLARVAARGPGRNYTADERLADFRASFATDLAVLDRDFLRFVERIDAGR